MYISSRLTLQEYLTAQYISDDNQLIKKLVTKHLTDDRWKEVFLLVAGIKNNADRLLELMEVETSKLIKTYKLKNLLEWVAKITDPHDTDFKYLGKRALCIANANANAYINAIANAYANVYAIVNGYANAIAIKKFLEYACWSQKWQIYQNIDYSTLIEELESCEKEIPDNRESKEVQQAFANRLLKTWFAAFETTPEAMTLSGEEIEILDKYLYANYLIIKCKEAATRVTDTAWKKIESRMLLPVD